MATKTSNFVSLRVSLFILLLFVSSQVGAAEAKYLQGLRRKLLAAHPSISIRAPPFFMPPTRHVPPWRPRVPPPPYILSAPPPPLMPSAPPPSHVSSLQSHMQDVPLPLPHASSPSSA